MSDVLADLKPKGQHGSNDAPDPGTERRDARERGPAFVYRPVVDQKQARCRALTLSGFPQVPLSEPAVSDVSSRRADRSGGARALENDRGSLRRGRFSETGSGRAPPSRWRPRSRQVSRRTSATIRCYVLWLALLLILLLPLRLLPSAVPDQMMGRTRCRCRQRRAEGDSRISMGPVSPAVVLTLAGRAACWSICSSGRRLWALVGLHRLKRRCQPFHPHGGTPGLLERGQEPWPACAPVISPMCPRQRCSELRRR